MNILGIVAHTLGYGDASAALAVDGEITGSIEEERFSRKRYDDTFPYKSIEFLLSQAGIRGKDIDIVALHLHPYRGFANRIYWLLRNAHRTFINSIGYLKYYNRYNTIRDDVANALESSNFTVEYYPHHECHVAAAFYSSPFEQSAFLSIDGSGEGLTGLYGSASIKYGIDIAGRFSYPHSLGMFYSAVCEHIGYPPPAGPGKVMGLSAYGDPERFLPLMRKMCRIEKGAITLDLSYFLFHKNMATPLSNKPWLTKKFIKETGITRRSSSQDLGTNHMDLAAALQARTNEIGLELSGMIAKLTGCKTLCMAGGVSLNSVMNGVITSSGIFDEVFIQPSPGDAGNAVGSVYLASLAHGRGILRYPSLPYTGPEFDDSEVEQSLQRLGISYNRSENICRDAAKAIKEGAIIGWFQGRMEFGPRALGNRSILADAQNKDMKDIINARVKHREFFRPFAPSVTREAYGRYFAGDDDNPFMQKVAFVHEKWRTVFPAITHVDMTARVQSVSRDKNPRFHRLLECLEEIHGHPVVLNTSFNDREPIVCTPDDAVNCFLKTDIDKLFISNFIVSKKMNAP